MSLPIFLHSGMVNAPALSIASVLDVLNSCLVSGFNSQSVSSASCSAGVVTLNFATAPGFSAKDTIKITGATNPIFNGNFRVIVATGNQLTFVVTSAPDGVVAGSISCKFAPLGWELLFSNSSTNVFRSIASNTQACARFKTDSTYLRLRGYHSMTSVDVGLNPFPTMGTISGDGPEYLIDNAVNLPWLLVGDDKFFYLFFGPNGGGINQLYFGDLNSFLPVDNFCAAASRRYSEPYPNAANDYDGYIMKSVTGTVGQGVRYHSILVAEYYIPSIDDTATNNIVIDGTVFAIENNGGNASVRGFYPGALQVFAKANSATPFFQVKENIGGYTGRLVLVRGSGNRVLGFSLDNDWRL